MQQLPELRVREHRPPHNTRRTSATGRARENCSQAATSAAASSTQQQPAAVSISDENGIDHSFEELRLPEDSVHEVNTTWTTFLRTGESREAAGEAIYAALFAAAPSLHNLFKTPRAGMAMRFVTGLNQIVGSPGDPIQR